MSIICFELDVTQTVDILLHTVTMLETGPATLHLFNAPFYVMVSHITHASSRGLHKVHGDSVASARAT